MRGKPNEVFGGYVELFGGIVRMSADRAIDFVIFLSNGKHLFEALHSRRDCHHAADTGREGTGDDGRPLLGEIRKVQMAMAVDQHHSAFLGLLDITWEHRLRRRQRRARHQRLFVAQMLEATLVRSDCQRVEQLCR